MSTNDAPTRTAETDVDQPDSGTGMAHLTVVPTNFDPDAAGRRRD